MDKFDYMVLQLSQIRDVLYAMEKASDDEHYSYEKALREAAESLDSAIDSVNEAKEESKETK